LDGGGVRLLDFGLARLKQSAPLTAPGTVMGSPSFMAPEAWKGVSDLMDARVDVYSLGVVLFRVLSGKLPFAGTSMQEKFLSATTGVRPSLRKFRPELPPEVDGWVQHALALDRDQRFGNVRALWTALESALRLNRRRIGLRPFWASAKDAVHKLVGNPEPVAPVARAFGANEPSFTRDALARSAYRINTVPEATIELTDGDLKPLPPPLSPPALLRPVEPTIHVADADLMIESERPDRQH
ncbi:MAG TPA: protein kinase, partial [Polyangiaceae bacterium]|nr:protein kinase [Polyangiaceae bacterium]